MSVTRSKWNSSEIFGIKFHLLYVHVKQQKKFLLSMWEAIFRPIYLLHKREDFCPKQKLLQVFCAQNHFFWPRVELSLTSVWHQDQVMFPEEKRSRKQASWVLVVQVKVIHEFRLLTFLPFPYVQLIESQVTTVLDSNQEVFIPVSMNANATSGIFGLP